VYSDVLNELSQLSAQLQVKKEDLVPVDAAVENSTTENTTAFKIDRESNGILHATSDHLSDNESDGASTIPEDDAVAENERTQVLAQDALEKSSEVGSTTMAIKTSDSKYSPHLSFVS
jgi:hypothetical protein